MSRRKSQSDGKAGKAKGGEDEWGTEHRRLSAAIIEVSQKTPAQMSAAVPYIAQSAPHIATAWMYFMMAMPHIIRAACAAHDFVQALPMEIIYAAVGFFICFFGGVFPATIAAGEAWYLCGGTEAVHCCQELLQEFRKVLAANKKDDDKDDDGDGVPDVKQIEAKDLVWRKAALVMKTVEPATINSGITGLYTGWIGVLAILKIKFAKTITLGNVLGERLYIGVSRFEPALLSAVPKEYEKWVPVALSWMCKAVAISMAWWIQRVISAIHSAIRGGHLFGKYVVTHLHKKGILKSTPEEWYFDEGIGWAIALVGFITQLVMGFYVPFPFNLVLWPVQILERVIIWSVTSS